MEHLAGGEVRLEQDDGSRLPPDVELAFFRVAQEALANAVKHGRPPIVVRYRASAGGATLTVDDAGPGIATGAAEAAPAAGHFGLLGMQQRAEQIGALLDVRRWPTEAPTALDWRARWRRRWSGQLIRVAVVDDHPLVATGRPPAPTGRGGDPGHCRATPVRCDPWTCCCSTSGSGRRVGSIC
jgi:hypothetical protein